MIHVHQQLLRDQNVRSGSPRIAQSSLHQARLEAKVRRARPQARLPRPRAPVSDGQAYLPQNAVHSPKTSAVHAFHPAALALHQLVRAVAARTSLFSRTQASASIPSSSLVKKMAFLLHNPSRTRHHPRSLRRLTSVPALPSPRTLRIPTRLRACRKHRAVHESLQHREFPGRPSQLVFHMPQALVLSLQLRTKVGFSPPSLALLLARGS